MRRTAVLAASIFGVTVLGAAADSVREVAVDASRDLRGDVVVAGLNLPEGVTARDWSAAGLDFAPPFGAPRGLDSSRLAVETWSFEQSRRDPPGRVAVEAARRRAALDRAGRSAARSVLADWRFTDLADADPRAAALLAFGLIVLSDAGVDEVYWTPRRAWRRGEPPPPAARAAALFAPLATTPRRLVARGGDEAGFGALAARSDDGQTVRIVLANAPRPVAAASEVEAPPSRFLLVVENLPWGREEFTWRRERLDGESGEFVARQGSGRGGRFRLLRQFAAPAVEWIELRRADAPPRAPLRGRGARGR